LEEESRVNTRSRLLILIGVLVAVTFSLTAGAANTTANAQTKVIRACVAKKGGNVRIIKKGHCKRSERKVTWNQVGVKGPSGPSANPAAALPGQKGATGATGAQGAQGLKGDAGAPGAKGDTGATGPSGVTSPLVFGPYANTGDPGDSSVCGGNWANETYTRTFIVTPQSDGSFQVTELVKGTFVTLAGSSPNDCKVTIAAGATGTWYGDWVFTIPATDHANFNFAEGSGGTGTEFVHSHFGAGTDFPLDYAWQFHYKSDTPSGGSWDNTQFGNTGNITG
jgi:hypothetical protein